MAETGQYKLGAVGGHRLRGKVGSRVIVCRGKKKGELRIIHKGRETRAGDGKPLGFE